METYRPSFLGELLHVDDFAEADDDLVESIRREESVAQHGVQELETELGVEGIREGEKRTDREFKVNRKINPADLNFLFFLGPSRNDASIPGEQIKKTTRLRIHV